MDDAQAIVAAAMARANARAAATPRIDYQRMNRRGPALKATLTRAVKSGDRDRVVIACRDAVREWDEIGAWPDDWSRWQRALDDCFPVFHAPDLRDLD